MLEVMFTEDPEISEDEKDNFDGHQDKLNEKEKRKSAFSHKEDDIAEGNNNADANRNSQERRQSQKGKSDRISYTGFAYSDCENKICIKDL